MCWPVGVVPIGHGDEVAVGVGWWSGGGVELGLVGDSGFDGGLHPIVDVEDGVFGSECSFLSDFAFFVFDLGALDVFAFYDREGFHDVFDRMSRSRKHLQQFGVCDGTQIA